jgi:YD repeat-containing protein
MPASRGGFLPPLCSGGRAVNNLLWSQSPLQGASNRPSFAYGNANHPFYASKHTDPQGGIWNYNYDESTGNLNGNLTSKTEGTAGQNPVRFTYNFGSTTHPNGTLATATDAKGAVTTYGYVWDAANPRLLKQMTVNPPAPLTATTINYDSLGRVSSEVDGNNNTRSYTYDALDRVKQVTYTNGGNSATISSVYDLNGNVSSLTDNTGTTSDTYDALNRLTKETRPDTSLLALYRSGRQAEALAVYREARETLVEQLGLDPSRPLQILEGAILRQEPLLDQFKWQG